MLDDRHLDPKPNNDIQLVNDLMTSLTMPEAIAAATVLRDELAEVRDLLKPFAS
jgi:hypothetical protein